MEELLGEVQDEHDRLQRQIVKQAESMVITDRCVPTSCGSAPGSASPQARTTRRSPGTSLDVLERIPAPGEEVRLERGVLRVERLTGSRIDRLRYVPDDKATDPAFGGTRERILESFEQEAAQ